MNTKNNMQITETTLDIAYANCNVVLTVQPNKFETAIFLLEKIRDVAYWYFLNGKITLTNDTSFFKDKSYICDRANLRLYVLNCRNKVITHYSGGNEYEHFVLDDDGNKYVSSKDKSVYLGNFECSHEIFCDLQTLSNSQDIVYPFDIIRDIALCKGYVCAVLSTQLFDEYHHQILIVGNTNKA